jgi:hypothetical protein
MARPMPLDAPVTSTRWPASGVSVASVNLVISFLYVVVRCWLADQEAEKSIRNDQMTK